MPWPATGGLRMWKEVVLAHDLNMDQTISIILQTLAPEQSVEAVLLMIPSMT
jgi:hypothetical protein